MDRKEDNRFRTVLRTTTERLRECLHEAPAGSGDTPYLDALVLMGHAAGMKTEQIFAAYDDPVPQDVLREFSRLAEDRCTGTPVSYLRGFKEFYGREFAVGPGVLVPRPDTEVLVEAVLEEVRRRAHPAADAAVPVAPAVHVHDCCTGSGCVAVTVAIETGCTVSASDISREALSYARPNADALGAQVAFMEGDLLGPLSAAIAGGGATPVLADAGEAPQTPGGLVLAPPDIIAANPPYVTDNEVTDLTDRGWPEPALALAGGQDGMDVVRRLAADAAACLPDGGCLMVEIGASQGEAAREILRDAGYRDIGVVQDLGERDRVCTGRWFRT